MIHIDDIYLGSSTSACVCAWTYTRWHAHGHAHTNVSGLLAEGKIWRGDLQLQQ